MCTYNSRLHIQVHFPYIQKSPHLQSYKSGSQVPCKQVIQHAKVSKTDDEGVRALARVSETHTEAGAHKVFQESGCTLDVPLSYMKLESGESLPYIRTTDWLRFLLRTNRLEYLTGEANPAKRQLALLHFWDMYSAINGDHPVYAEAAAGRIQLHEAIPVFHHGDEGRGFKRAGVLIVSTHGVMGRGCAKGVQTSRPSALSPDDPLCLNLIGHSLTRQFVFCTVPNSMYKDAPETFHQILSVYAQEMRSLFYDGICHGAEKIHLVCLSIKGDNVYLAKAANMTRTFSRMPKSQSSRKASAGVCWLCLAGKEDHTFPVPFEDLSERTAWMHTCGQTLPWNTPSELLQIPFTDAIVEQFFQIDLFHGFHLGCGKYFLASAISMLLEFIAGNSVAEKLESLTLDMKSYCKRTHQAPYISALTDEVLNMKSSKDTPNGGWSKAHTTTVLMKWFQDYLCRNFLENTDTTVQQIASWTNHCNFYFDACVGQVTYKILCLLFLALISVL